MNKKLDKRHFKIVSVKISADSYTVIALFNGNKNENYCKTLRA